MIERLVVPLDLSEVSWRAVPAALLVARTHHVPIQLVVVQSPGVDPLESMASLEDAESEIDAPMLPPVVLEANDVAGALLAHVGRDGHTLLCMSTHGRGGFGRALLGSTAAAVLAESSHAVLLVGPHADVRPELTDIDVLIDPDGDERQLVVANAINMAGPRSVLHLICVTHPAHDLLVHEQRWCEAAGVPFDCEVQHGGDVVGGAVATAWSRGTALIVVDGGADRLVRRAPCPVLAVPKRCDHINPRRNR